MTLRVLHVTPHLGGGVGRVLSRVAAYHHARATGVEERFLCLEPAQRTQYADAITAVGAPVMFPADAPDLAAQLAWADILQLEWWHHPAMACWLTGQPPLTCRLAVWAHTSGLHYPAFPEGFPALPHVFMATTAASPAGIVVPSSGGFDDMPARAQAAAPSPRYGYLGSLEKAKLHPRIMDFIAAAPEDFHVEIYGDTVPGTPLHPSPRLTLKGYTTQPAAALAGMDILVYLLNPLHYGTTENALLEAMAAGVVPIVMDNPVEAAIVRHGVTGMVVHSPADFAKAVDYLQKNPEARHRMAEAAAADIRARFPLAVTADGLIAQYRTIMQQEPRPFHFASVWGDTPFAWFTAGLGKYAALFAPGAEENQRVARQQLPFLYEPNKSSVFHFQRQFPKDALLKHWADILEAERVDASPVH
ncbi:MAG: glycosyltransferase family 4 protein [Alphaproteobacteria bacterium]|nr:glycosyltransferase family 4 protein [Alphaproteobacteria bacterium]